MEEEHVSSNERVTKRVTLLDVSEVSGNDVGQSTPAHRDNVPGRCSARDPPELSNEQPFTRPSHDVMIHAQRNLRISALQTEAEGPMPPSYHAVMTGLLQQKGYIRTQQAHLMEMSRALERTLDEAEHATAALFGAPAGLSIAARRRAHGHGPVSPTVHAEANYSGLVSAATLDLQIPRTCSLPEEMGKYHRHVSPSSDTYDSEMGARQATTSLYPGPSKDSAGLSMHGSVASSSPPASSVAHGGSETAMLHQILDDLSCNGGSRGSALKIAKRLQSRLGVHSLNTIITAKRLSQTLARLGSYKYSEAELSNMLEMIAFLTGSTPQPKLGDDSMEKVTANVQGVPCSALVKFFAASGEDHGSIGVDEGLRDMTIACREILLSGDANKFVAELVKVNVDDIAQRAQTDAFTMYVEPFMSVIILLNTAAIGFGVSDETDRERPDNLWFWVDSGFTLCFLIELMLKVSIRGWPPHNSRNELWWNITDLVLVVLGLLDIVLTLSLEANPATNIFAVLRFVRLLRLSRLLLFFRAKHLRELSLMMKGLIAGMRTLLWANVLLLFAVYLLGVVAKKSLGGRQPAESEKDMFRSVPLAMFTVFRCLMGDCMDEEGRPIVFLYYESHGAAFVITYVLAMVLCVFGVFNLIFAIYIETTLAAAKKQCKMDKTESVRVARLARELLKKFALAQALLEQQDPDERDSFGETMEFTQNMRRARHSAEMDPGTFKITRELFELVLTDKEVGTLLDELDISAERAGLFDILDADSSGVIEATELIHGLLQVRGEAKKSDVVANLLAVRAVQGMLRGLQEEHHQLRGDIRRMASIVHSLPQSWHRLSKESMQG